MNSFQNILMRLVGPFLFVMAFSLFAGLSGRVSDLMVAVRGELVQDEVYSQSNYVIDYDDNGVQNQDISGGVVNGSYLVGLICSGVTVNTIIIDETDHTHKYKITFDSKLLGTTYYTVEDTTELVAKIEAYGSYSANTAFDFNVYVAPTAQYVMEYVYGDTGAIDSVVFTRG